MCPHPITSPMKSKANNYLNALKFSIKNPFIPLRSKSNINYIHHATTATFKTNNFIFNIIKTIFLQASNFINFIYKIN